MTGIVCGTGFVKSALALPVLRRLAQTYDVPIERERIRLKTQLRRPAARPPRLAAGDDGPDLEHVVPNADTIAGLKYQARRFVGDCFRAEGIKARSLPGRASAMQVGLARDTAKAAPSASEDQAARVRRRPSMCPTPTGRIHTQGGDLPCRRSSA